MMRIILKDLKIGVRHESCLKAFHPMGLNSYNMTSSLAKVCDFVSNPNKATMKKIQRLANNLDPNSKHNNEGNEIFYQIELFQPIRPMLASRHHWKHVIREMNLISKKQIKSGQKIEANIGKIDGSVFGIEIKFDGERAMIHYNKQKNEIRILSRNAVDLDKKYNYKIAFAPIIKECLDCETCIIDGEMCAWDSELDTFLPFGSNRTVAVNMIENNSNKNSNFNKQRSDRFGSVSKLLNEKGLDKAHLYFIAFDVLMANNEITMDLPLAQRRMILKKIIKPKKTYFEMTDMITGVKDTKSIMDCLDRALMDSHEGIIIKHLNSSYVPNRRGNEWIKLKPDYVEDMVSHMDLIVLGGYFGKGRRRVGDVSHFLLGCVANDLENEEKEESIELNNNNNNNSNDINEEYPKKFYTFCKVGSGYSNNELSELQGYLRPHWKKYRLNEIEAKCPHLVRWMPQPDDVPDFWIEPKNSILIELLANEIVPCQNTKFSAGLTVRFPRCKAFRYDKPWYQCMSIKDIRNRYQSLQMHHNYKAVEIANRSNARSNNNNNELDPNNPANIQLIKHLEELGLGGADFINSNNNNNNNNGMDFDNIDDLDEMDALDKELFDFGDDFDFSMDGKGRRKGRRKGVRRAPEVMPSFLPVDASNVRKESNIFANKEFCVINGINESDELQYNSLQENINNELPALQLAREAAIIEMDGKLDKQMLERLIIANGGNITQNPLFSTNYIIAFKKTMKVKNLIARNYNDSNVANIVKQEKKSGKGKKKMKIEENIIDIVEDHNILRPLWLVECIVSRQLIFNYAPRHLLHATKSMLRLLEKDYDIYGDHFENEINETQLLECFKAMQNVEKRMKKEKLWKRREQKQQIIKKENEAKKQIIMKKNEKKQKQKKKKKKKKKPTNKKSDKMEIDDDETTSESDFESELSSENEDNNNNNNNDKDVSLGASLEDYDLQMSVLDAFESEMSDNDKELEKSKDLLQFIKDCNFSDDEELELKTQSNLLVGCNIYVDMYESVHYFEYYKNMSENEIENKTNDLIRSSSMRLVAARCQLYGAKIANMIDLNTTHILVKNQGWHRPNLEEIHKCNRKMMDDPNYLFRAPVLVSKWVDHSIRAGQKITDVAPYQPKQKSYQFKL